MAEDAGREGVSAATFYSAVAGIYVAMSLVLIVAARPEDNWVRLLIQWLLIAQALVWAGLTIWLRFRKRAPSEPPA